MVPDGGTTPVARIAARNWWIVLVWGVLTTLLGAYFVVGGIFDIVGAVMDRVNGWVIQLLLGILYVAAGIAVLGAPVLAAIVGLQLLYFFIAFSAILGGIIKIVQSLMAIGRAGFWGVLGLLLLGILQLVIGLLLLETPLSGDPISGPLTLVPVMGIFTIAAGITAILASLRIRNLN